MHGSCNYIDLNGQRCNKTFFLHDIYLKDPYSPTSNELVNICEKHYKELTGEMTERLRDFQRKILNLRAEQARLKRTAREYDTFYDGTKLQQKIDDLSVISKKILTGECKNYFCMANLRGLDKNTKIYSAHTFMPSGRRHYSFYYCSFKCFNIMRSKCGILSPYIIGQTIL